MDLYTACELLNIRVSERNNKVLIKQRFKKACLKYHPDKNGNEEQFIKLKEAYDFLNKKNESFMDQFEESLLRKYVFLLKTIENPLFKHPLFLKYVLNPVENHLSEYKTYVLNPTIENLLNKDIYYLEDEHIYIPLWHHEILFHKKIKVIIKPILYEMELDDDNNIYIKRENLHLLNISNLNKSEIPEKGIPRIQGENIYDASKLSTIFIVL
jgi:curved DNA-binding protein CbpA